MKRILAVIDAQRSAAARHTADHTETSNHEPSAGARLVVDCGGIIECTAMWALILYRPAGHDPWRRRLCYHNHLAWCSGVYGTLHRLHSATDQNFPRASGMY